MDPRNFMFLVLSNLQNCHINSPLFFFFFFQETETQSYTSIKWQASGLTLALPTAHRADVSGTAAVGVGRRVTATDV